MSARAVDEAAFEQAGRKGLDLVDEALAKRPKMDGQALSDACQTLCLYREGLIARSRAGGESARRNLERLNAVLAVVVGVHFPLGNAPWDELEKCRGWLADLVREVHPPGAN